MKNNDQLEDLYERGLTDLAEGAPFAPGLDFDAVAGRAGRIRRNRRIAGAVAVAAVTAVVIPTVLSVTGGPRAERDLQPTLPSPDTPTQVARTTLTLDGLPRGAVPGIEYFTTDGVVLPDRGLVPTDQSYQALVPSAADGGPGGFVAVEPDGQHLRVLTKDFEPQSGSATTQSFVTDTQRDHYAFVAVEAGAQTLVSRDTTDAEGGMTWQLPATGVADVAGYLGDDRVLVENVDQNDGSSDLMIAEPDGSLTKVPGYLKALSTSAEADAFAVQTSDGPDGPCFAVVDSTSLTEKWDTCDYKLGGFSPDGHYVLATSPLTDGMGPRDVEVLDAGTGDLVASFTPDKNSQLFMVGVAWETSDTFLANAYEGTSGSIIRMGVDGSLEDAVAPVHVGDVFGDLPFWFGYDRVHGL
jgi:hypothetical protein